MRQPSLLWSFKTITQSRNFSVPPSSSPRTLVQILGITQLLTSAWDGVLCLKQVMKTTNGQSSGCIMTPAAWAQLTWKDVGHRPCEHCTQQPAILFLLFLQKMHFCGQETRGYWLALGFIPHKGLVGLAVKAYHIITVPFSLFENTAAFWLNRSRQLPVLSLWQDNNS